MRTFGRHTSSTGSRQVKVKRRYGRLLAIRPIPVCCDVRRLNALPVWRAAINHSQRRMSEVAIVSLCESGEPRDLARIASAGVARNVILRVSILRGLWRIGSPYLEAQLASALKDRS